MTRPQGGAPADQPEAPGGWGVLNIALGALAGLINLPVDASCAKARRRWPASKGADLGGAG
jgi:hypothetical protein